jgi:hypothetical protein
VGDTRLAEAILLCHVVNVVVVKKFVMWEGGEEDCLAPERK